MNNHDFKRVCPSGNYMLENIPKTYICIKCGDITTNDTYICDQCYQEIRELDDSHEKN